jgi:hypothetical protein
MFCDTIYGGVRGRVAGTLWWVSASASSEVLIWATTSGSADSLALALSAPSRSLRVLELDADLAQAGRSAPGAILVAEAGPRLEAQRAFLGLPLVLVAPSDEKASSTKLARRAYAVVRNATEAALAVDRLVEHQQLAQQASRRREPPRRCSRCGRGFDARKVRDGGVARRFVKFGGVSLCGSCVDALRRLLREADAPFVEADVRH